MDIAPELFDASVLGDANAIRGQWMAIMNGIQTPAMQFDWTGANWTNIRRRVEATANNRPAPTPPALKQQQQTKGGQTDEYVWGKEKPAGESEGGTVLPALVKKAVADSLLVQGDDRGLVTVGGSTYIVEKKKAPAANVPPGGAASSAVGLGRFRESVIFAPEYQRVAEKVLRDVSQRSESVEQ